MGGRSVGAWGDGLVVLRPVLTINYAQGCPAVVGGSVMPRVVRMTIPRVWPQFPFDLRTTTSQKRRTRI